MLRRMRATWVQGHVVRWLAGSLSLPRFGFVAAGLALAAAISASAYVVVSGVRAGAAMNQHVIVTVQLGATTRRGPMAGPAMDRVWLPSNANEVQLIVAVPGAASGERFEPDLEALDSQAVARLTVLRTDRTTTAALLTLTVAASRLVDGDYVLRIRRVAGGLPDVVATQAFRVARRR